MRYRPEIDGLRALAVIPVILFHAGFAWFSGGFVGVDVFFVISGYLITGIILGELDKGSFSIVNFYERRARRILPALFLVLLACLPMAWLTMLPQDMKSFSQSLVAVTVFASNILFWLTSGYFETATELKPLLHTWSLAVEEQYYVFFPVFLMLAWRLGRRRLLAIMAIAAVASLALAEWGSRAAPSATFYLLPARGWELLIGAFAAFYHASDPPRPSAFVRQTGSTAGLALLAFSVLYFDEKIPFPSLHALAPTIGTVLLLLYAVPQTAVGKVLAHKSLVGVGLISYSAYLWHQPLFAFARHRSLDEPGELTFIILAVLSILLAWFSWRYVERPFRDKQKFNRKQIFIFGAVGSIFFAAFGLVGHFTKGFEKLWLEKTPPAQAALYQKYQREYDINRRQVFHEDVAQDNGDCRFDARNLKPEVTDRLRQCRAKYGPGVLILGDSHAVDLYGMVSSSNPEEKFLVGLTQGGCRPHTRAKNCSYDDFLAFIKTGKDIFSVVIFEQAGFYLLKTNTGDGNRDMFATLPISAPVTGISTHEEFVAMTYQYLKKVSEHVPVVWYGPRMEHHINLKSMLHFGCDHEYSLRPGQQEIFGRLDDHIAQLVAKDRALVYVSQNKALQFDFRREFLTCDRLYWADGDHFSTEGERYFGSKFNLLQYIRSGRATAGGS